MRTKRLALKILHFLLMCTILLSRTVTIPEFKIGAISG